MTHSVKALERQLAGQKESVEQHKALERLLNNRDFKKLIMEEFCVKECARYAQLSADPQLDATARSDSMGMAQAAGYLRRWLQAKTQLGLAAANTIPSIQDELDQARLEEMNADLEQE